MQYSWVIWSTFYVTGAVFTRIEADDKDNNTRTSTDSSFDDYDPTYPDYDIHRDYLNFDYYDDDRDGRSLNRDHNGSPSEDSNDSHKQAVDDFMMKQLQSTIPGTPGEDYALYQSVPDTSFQCENQRSPGFYGDVESQCQVFHICQEDHRHDSFLCPVGTVFNQISFICDWWFNFRCEDTPKFYHLNNKFHSPTGSTSMRDTMKRMRNFQDKKDMSMIMGLAKVHKNLHSIKNMMNNDSEKRSQTSKSSRNLFMLGMRKNKLGRIRATLTSKRSTEDAATTDNHQPTLPTDRTPSVLKAMSSTGYLDISLSEYTTTTNASFDDFSSNTPPIQEYANNFTEPLSSIEVIPNNASILNIPFRSLLNLSSIDVVINGSIVTTVKLDHVEVSHTEVSTVSESTTTDSNPINKTEETVIVREENEKEMNTENGHFENLPELEIKTEKLNTEKEINVDNENTTVPSTMEFSSEPTILPSNEPFNHENNFIIGNDTHISVSVTIHSKSGRSKLQWKRLPGVKRIRKIRFKNSEENTTTENPTSETIYRKRNEEKPRSRIMWIPAKKNALERRMDWKTFLESRDYDTVATIRIKPDHNQPLKTLEKAAMESSVIPPISISDISYTSKENKTKNSQESSINTTTKESLSENPNVSHTSENASTELVLLTTDESTESHIKVENISNSDTQIHNETEIESNRNKNQSVETQDNCKTICIKLLRSLYKNSSHEFPSFTNFVKTPTALTLFNYDSSETEHNPKYGRKSVLGVSSSEQWTVKYDPGPNCNENTENDKVLIKGWSVIIDTGSVTKEKTVKKRGCTNASDNSKIVMMENFSPYKNSEDGGIKFNTETSHLPLNSKANFGSTDQRYWLNLVRNWLEQSPNIKQEIRKYDQNAPSDQSWMFDKNPNSGKNRHDIPDHKHIPKRQQSYNSRSENSGRNKFPKHEPMLGHGNQEFNFETKRNKKNHAKNSMDATLFPRNMNDRRSQINTQSSKPDWHSDLQTERSDWFQATQKTTDWSNGGINIKDSTGDNIRDWISELRNKDDHPIIDNRKGSFLTRRSDHKNYDSDFQSDWASASKDTDSSVSQDYDDWSLKKTQSSDDWVDSRRDEGWRSKSDKREMPKENWQDQEEKRDSISSRDRSAWDSRRDSRSSNGNKRTTMNKPNKDMWPKSDTRANDWSAGSRNKNRDTRRDDSGISWKQERGQDSSDNYWKRNKNLQDEMDYDVRTNKGQRSRPSSSTRDTRGRSVSDEWNWASEKGYDASFRPSGDGRNDWSSMKSADFDWSTDKKIPRKEDGWPSRGPNLSSQRPKEDNFRTPKGKDWSSDEPNTWKRDSDTQWLMGDSRKENKRRKLPEENKGNMPRSRNDWNSDNNNWSDEEQGNYEPPQDRNWNDQRDKKGDIYRGSKRGRDSKPNEKPDWSSGSRGGRNKGFNVQNMESSVWSSQNNPDWKDDEKTDNTWSPKSFKSGGSRSSDSSPRRTNIKGDSNMGFRRPKIPSISQKSWSSNNRNDWKDEETWMSDNSGKKSTQRGAEGNFPKHAINMPRWKSDSQEWFSEENKGQDKPKNIPWNTQKADTSDGSPRNSNSWGKRRKMESDWTSEADLWPNRNPSTKGMRGDDKGSSEPDIWNKDNTFNKGTDSWPSKNPPDNDGNKGNTPKTDTKNNRNSWGSSKDGKGSMRPPQNPSQKGSARSRPTMPWKSNNNSPKNVSTDKGDTAMKKIVWSVQISTDGKTGNGWVPITLRPELRSRVNESRNDWNNKDSSSGEEDWSSKDMKNSDWNSEISQYSQTTPEQINDDATEASSTSHIPEASFSHLFYIPAFNSRYKREYQTRKLRRRLQARGTENLPYKIIKSGEVLNDVSKDNNKFFLARADILVEDHRDSNNRENLHPGLRRILSPDNAEIIPQNSKPVIINSTGNNTGSFRSTAEQVINSDWDTFPKESVIRERWSSPFNSHNFSESGWIPVIAFKPSSSRNFTELNSFIYGKSNEFINVKKLHDKTEEPGLHESIGTQTLDHLSARNKSHDLTPDFQPKAINILLQGEILNNSKDGTNADQFNRKYENGTEMKVGNKTLRILPFSDVMKQFQNEENPFQDSYKFETHGVSWNVPIRIDPKTYSLKLLDPSREIKENISNSWTFASNRNDSKQAWILIGNDNKTRPSPSNQTGELERNSDLKTPDVYKIIVGNRTTTSDINRKFYNSTVSLQQNVEGQSKNKTFHFGSRNWNSESDWKPVIKTVGRVVSYNRTLLLGKESTVK